MSMLVGFSSTNDRFRARTDRLVVYQLRRKQCHCGRVITAKQLAQYGRCSSCSRQGVTDRSLA